ncbi:MAG TPA: protein phosphatase 2C domain-containing protein [Bryobacteraceae bacterium]|jgi:serine/threonine protein phosphatase PrpC|nr:protein phosphatase 2C domain-containing protein [Bryobacteraceae bacterium]
MLEAFALSDVGRVRTNNEDCALILPEIGLYLLADGMGGARAGEMASRLAVDTVAQVVKESWQRDPQVLLSAVEEANRRVLEASNSDPQLEGMGTTLVAVLETGEDLAIASVGDSRAYLLDDAGFRAVTEDQTWVHEVGRPLGLDEESLRNHPMRHVLTMAIGVGGALAVHYYMIHLKPSALLLMCSDGLHGVIEPTVIENILRDNSSGHDQLQYKCQKLVDCAKEAGGPDNVTCVILRGMGAWPAPSDHQQ